jgi:hypothetical protein
MQQHERIITADPVTDLEDKIIFLERELADAAREQIMLQDVIINLSKKIQKLEQELATRDQTPYKY